MPDDVRELFAEYADAYARGERPRVRDYLARAGEDAETLATMIDRFLGTVRTHPATQEDRERLAALLATPLLERRKRRRLRIDDVVDALMAALGLEAEKRQKLRLYYQRLENGTLDPTGVSERVWAALEKTLGGKPVLARAPRQLRADAEVAYYRVDPSLAQASALPPEAALGSLPRREQHDEVDELFLGAR